MTAKIQCKCSNAFQDSTYGKGVRLANACLVKTKLTGYRCTVCGIKYGDMEVKKA